MVNRKLPTVNRFPFPLVFHLKLKPGPRELSCGEYQVLFDLLSGKRVAVLETPTVYSVFVQRGPPPVRSLEECWRACRANKRALESMCEIFEWEYT